MKSNALKVRALRLALLGIFSLFVAGSTRSQELTYENGVPHADIKTKAGQILVWYSDPGKVIFGRGVAFIEGNEEDRFAKKDTVKVSVSYEVHGEHLTEPKTWYLEVFASSGDRLRFKNNHWLKISADGKEILSRDLDLRANPRGIQSQYFVLTPIPYEVLLGIIHGQNVVFQIGDAQIPLSSEILELLRRQDALIEREREREKE